MAGDAAPGALFDFTVPDELLKEAVSRHRDPEVVADLELMPGTGEGKPPPLAGIFQKVGYAPLVLMTLAAFVPGMISNGLGVLGPNVQHSFHLDLAELGAVAFVAAVAQIAWGLPVAILGDRGSRKVVTAVTLLIFAVAVPLMAVSTNIWFFVLFYLIAAVAFGTSDTVMNSFLADAYPTGGAGAVFALRNISDPLAQTVGVAVMTTIAAATGNWRYSLLVALIAIPIALRLFRVHEPAKGQNESHHILDELGDGHRGPAGRRPEGAVQLRGDPHHADPVPVLRARRGRDPRLRRHRDPAVRVDLLQAGLAPGHRRTRPHLRDHRALGLRRDPDGVGPSATACSARRRSARSSSRQSASPCSAGCSRCRSTCRRSGSSSCSSSSPTSRSRRSPSRSSRPSPRRRRPRCARSRSRSSACTGSCSEASPAPWSSAPFADAAGVTAALTVIGPVCAAGGVLLWLGSRHVRRDITLVIEDVLERYAEGKRRQSGGAIPALQVHNLDFFYGSNQVLFDVNIEVAEGEIVALLGTNGAGKSTLLRAVSGLDHPHRGVIRIFGVNCTYLEPEQIIGESVSLLVGGKMTFPGLTVRDNLRVGEYSIRRDGPRAGEAMTRRSTSSRSSPRGSTSRRARCRAVSSRCSRSPRVMMTRPRLLMIDELALGLAPKTVDRLMDIVRRVNADGTTVILVEQSVNRAMSLADHAFFIERGQVRFDGPTSELLLRDDLLRPVFLAEATAGLG